MVQIGSDWFLDIQLDEKNCIKLGMISGWGHVPNPYPALSFVLLSLIIGKLGVLLVTLEHVQACYAWKMQALNGQWFHILKNQ